MTPEQIEAERRILASLAACVVATCRKVAAEHGLPTMASATALIAAACFLAEEAAGMLEWLAAQLEGQAGAPGDIANKPK